MFFNEKNYIEQNQDTPDAILAQKHEKKALQLIICGGGIGAGIVASFITGSTSIICSALSARHANVLRQQQKLLTEIQLAREEKWIREAAKVQYPFAAYSTTDSGTLFLNAGGLVVIKRAAAVPRPLSRVFGQYPPKGVDLDYCPSHKPEQGPDIVPEEVSHAI